MTELTEAKVLFENLRDAGRKLAAELSSYAGQPAVAQSTVIFAIPNGGVPLAVEVANTLKADLSIIVCRKLVSPLVPEGGLGAVADDGTVVLDEDAVQRNGLSREQIDYEAEKAKANVKQRKLKYLGNVPSPRLVGKTVIIVDDGLASGITMAVAIESIKHRRPKEVLAAVPVASKTGFVRASKAAKVVSCAVASMSTFYLADFYRHFPDITDDEALHALGQWKKRRGF
jgi:putative phosphoribosyl transferase